VVVGWILTKASVDKKGEAENPSSRKSSLIIMAGGFELIAVGQVDLDVVMIVA